MAGSPVRRRPQTLKQAKKAHQKNGGVKKPSEREVRQIERAAELQERAARIRDREARRKFNLLKKEERLEKERIARANAGLQDVSLGKLGKIGASQCRLGSQWIARGKQSIVVSAKRSPCEEAFGGSLEGQHNTCDFEERNDEWSPPMSAQKRKRPRNTSDTIQNTRTSTANGVGGGSPSRAPLGILDTNTRSVSKTVHKPSTPNKSITASQRSSQPSTSLCPSNSKPRTEFRSNRQHPDTTSPIPNVPMSKHRDADFLAHSSNLKAKYQASKDRAAGMSPIRATTMAPPSRSAVAKTLHQVSTDDWDFAFPSNTQIEREIVSSTNYTSGVQWQAIHRSPGNPFGPLATGAPLRKEKAHSAPGAPSSEDPSRPTKKDKDPLRIESGVDLLFGISTQDLEYDLTEEAQPAYTTSSKIKEARCLDQSSNPRMVIREQGDDLNIVLRDETLIEAFTASLSDDEDVIDERRKSIVGRGTLTEHEHVEATAENNRCANFGPRQAHGLNDSFGSDLCDLGSQEIIVLDNLMTGCSNVSGVPV